MLRTMRNMQLSRRQFDVWRALSFLEDITLEGEVKPEQEIRSPRETVKCPKGWMLRMGN